MLRTPKDCLSFFHCTPDYLLDDLVLACLSDATWCPSPFPCFVATTRPSQHALPSCLPISQRSPHPPVSFLNSQLIFHLFRGSSLNTGSKEPPLSLCKHPTLPYSLSYQPIFSSRSKYTPTQTQMFPSVAECSVVRTGIASTLHMTPLSPRPATAPGNGEHSALVE